VDGCYSHWVGGCWSLLSAALGLITTDLWSREGLARYILSCCQSPRGGLRDKPSKHPDAYHTNYCLAGLSAAQYVAEYVALEGEDEKETLEDENAGIVPLTAPFQWRIARESGGPWSEDVKVNPVHPVFVVPVDRVKECQDYFGSKSGF
jgi:protein farnesyltransferase subunit beta